MELWKIRKYRKRHRAIRSMLWGNPAFAVGLDLPFLIATSISLKAAAAISLELLVIHMGTVAAALLTRRFLSEWLRPAFNVLVSTLLMVAVRLWMVAAFRGVADALGMYIYLMAVNGMTLLQASTLGKRQKAVQALLGALVNVVCFAAAIFLFSLLREYFGNNTLWGVPVPAPLRLDGMLVPFFGFVMAGVFLAASRSLGKKLSLLFMRERARREARFSVVSHR